MWKLWHFLFGWDYVVFPIAFSQSIRRIRRTPNGKEYVLWCGNIYFVGDKSREWVHLTRKPLLTTVISGQLYHYNRRL